MPLRLIDATGAQELVFSQLQQLYMHDISEFTGIEPADSGRYETEGVFCLDGIENHLIYLRGKPAGFLSYRCIAEGPLLPTYTLDHFFILRSYRKLGIGEEVSRILFDQVHGRWEVPVEITNEPAISFLRQVLRRYTLRNYRELSSPSGNSRIFEFQSQQIEQSLDA